MRDTRFLAYSIVVLLVLVACGASEQDEESAAERSGTSGAPHARLGSSSDQRNPDDDAVQTEHAKIGDGHGGAQHGEPNALVHEKSPYLLQHAYNPVRWYPWGEEAFAKAQAENKPIFLSIGYSTCHWCHVMERESFENEDVAALMNDYYVSIKVDREERPDVDKVYMNAVTAMTGSGGWPLSAWLTPEGKPFYTGTYFPPDNRYGRPGFSQVLTYFGDLWRANPDTLRLQGARVTQHLQTMVSQLGAIALSDTTLERAARQMAARYDPEWGGFGGAPKFPKSHSLSFLLRHWNRKRNAKSLEMVEGTLDHMARGGMADHLGGGFHRYSVDVEWLVPHFEKMLYDQALLAQTYLEAYQATGDETYADVARGIFTYVLRDMTDPVGAFHAAEDADSEGHEGTFYLWTPPQVIEVLGADLGQRFNTVYGVTEGGNFENTGGSILHLPKPMDVVATELGIESGALAREMQGARDRLLEVRSTRIRPHLDDKIITAWNALMISALARGASILDAPTYAAAAGRAMDFLLTELRDEQGVVLRRYRDGEAAFPAYIDDYAYLVNALADLYEATFDPRYLTEGVELAQAMIEQFWDAEVGGFAFQGDHNEELVVNTVEVHDGARPSGNSIAALALLRLGHLTGNTELDGRGRGVLDAYSGQIDRAPSSYTQMLIALDFAIGPTLEVVIAGEPEAADTQDMLRSIHRRFLPNKVLAVRPAGEAGHALSELAPFLSEQHPIDGRATAYVCRNHACRLPTNDASQMMGLIDDAILAN